ncbi:glycosyl hydrolase [Arcicella sp. LKC2W]|uniref:glycoside hydrolase family 26 protein n=1 Tax=Arcicella sp. LKC2W TaxID=2984198 RepID=UPI002B2046A0|nr:glycosyl hydrolase [Arcicella sp. LKC2W]MEA5461088.1 glycosyl hydrolase [Arcicella sp. LKC2W]
MKIYIKYQLLFLLLMMVITLNAQYSPIDKFATPQTKIFYKNLVRQTQKGFMFGHQDDLAYGIGWKEVEGESDVKRVTGQYPAVFGWDLGHIELDSSKNLDGVSFEKIKKYIQDVHAQGGVNTMTWHLRNPYNGKTAWDVDSVVKHILINGDKYSLYQSWLNKVAVFFKSLKDENGNPIPIIFRPFHEHNGSWFWWGKNHCSPEEYKQLYQDLVKYMSSQGVHNVVYAYSTDNFLDETDYLERYPGNDFVDILGFDSYQKNAPLSNKQFISDLRRMLSTIGNYGKKYKKITAITETGLETISESKWWTNILLKGINNHKISYVLVWRNGRPDHYYAPYPQQISANNFKKFTKNPKVYLGQKIKTSKLYN